jgi:hypothetical protein
MYFREHGIAHFHAISCEFDRVFEVDTLEMIEGDLPRREQKLLLEWAEPIVRNSARCGRRKSTSRFPD